MRQKEGAPAGHLPELLALVRAAGRAIMGVYDSDAAHEVTIKADDSPLTQADLRAHEVLTQGLMRLTAAIPVVSEEDAASHAQRMPESVFWLIDPLDGTKEFIARNGEFTVNVALVAGGYPLLGVVYAPALDLLYWGGVEVGAWRQHGDDAPERIAVALAQKESVVRVVASKSHLDERTMAFIERLGAHALVQAGSSLKFCRVAEGSADVYPRLAPTCEWDTAAAQAVLEAAGGYVTKLDGERLVYGKPEILNPHFIASARHPSELPGFDD